MPPHCGREPRLGAGAFATRAKPASVRRMASSKPTLEEAVSILLQNPHGGGAARSNQPQALSITQPLSMTSHPSAPAVVFTLATETLFKVVQNLVAHPENPAFRVLKRSSNAFSTKLAPAMGAVRFLRAIGFVEEGTSGAEDAIFTLGQPDAELLVAAKAMLKAGVKEYRRREEAARVEENKACAKQLADLQELSKQNHAKRNAEAQAERDRMNKIAEIDKWEKARQADPNCVL